MALNHYFRRDKLLLAVAFMAFILILTHIPQGKDTPGLSIMGFDKGLHLIAYGTIAGLLAGSMTRPLSLSRCAVLLLLIGAVAGADELTQPWCHRTGSVYDWLADVVGVGLGLLLFYGRRGIAMKAPVAAATQSNRQDR